LEAAFFVTAADGKITDEESSLLSALASALEMSPAHFKGRSRSCCKTIP
jgi:tellurite resistance protein